MLEKYPRTKEIISLLGAGILVSSIIVLPGVGVALGMVEKERRKMIWNRQQKEWKRFNTYLLRRNLKRLQEQKMIETVEENGESVIRLTQKGRTKHLKFRLEDLSIKNRRWDGKWRLVLYDIVKFKKHQRDTFRNILKYGNFLQLQRSVYLTPYPCEELIAYLREYFDIGSEVILVWSQKIENEDVYKTYFGL